jgi:hypothetical protein
VEQVFKEDRYMAPHYAYYVREMKIKAYAQVRGLKIRIYVLTMNQISIMTIPNGHLRHSVYRLEIQSVILVFSTPLVN